jgi:hypothetical protein
LQKEKKSNVNIEKSLDQGIREPIHSKCIGEKCAGFARLDGDWVW